MGGLALPGQAVIPNRYGESMVLFTSGEKVCCVVDGAPPGADGRLFTLEPGKPKKVPYEAGRFILEHMSYTGVVRVQETETDDGITYDIEGAKKASEDLLKEQDARRFQRFVNDMVEDYVKRSKPVPQPPEPILAIIKRRAYDLKSYGIVPIGWEAPVTDDPRVTDLQNQLAQLRAQLAQQDKDRKGK